MRQEITENGFFRGEAVMRKTVFRNYRYRDCDAFADWLGEMAAQGWHLKDWRFGLRFEKGEPVQAHYAAEVFAKGSEMDTLPGPDAEEFAEYCAAAGWRLVDGRGRFCIFIREREDAEPIMTPQERFANVKKAERISWLNGSCSFWMLAVLYWLQLLTVDSASFLFSNTMLGILLLVTLEAMGGLLKGLSLLVWCTRTARRLGSGEIPYYGKQGQKVRTAPKITAAVSVLLLIEVLAILDGMKAAAVILPVYFAAALALYLLIGRLRLSRDGNWIFQLGGGAVLAFALILVYVLLTFSTDSREKAGQESHRSVLGSVSVWQEGADSALVRIAEESGAVSAPSQGMKCLRLTVYESRFPRLLDRLWEKEVKRPEEWQDCTAQWGAQMAAEQGFRCCVRYEGRLLVFFAA